MTRDRLLQEIIHCYNHITGHNYKFSGYDNKRAAEHLADIAEQYGADSLHLMRDMHASGQLDTNSFVNACKQVEGKIKAKPEAPAPKQETSDMAMLAEVLSNVIKSASTPVVEESVKQELKDDIAKWILETYGPLERQVTVVVNGNKAKAKGIIHEKLEVVLNCVASDVPVFLTGPAGSGKNVLCKQIAECLDIPFYFSNAVSQEYKITGFTDANGVYQESQFYKAFKNGGLFMLDEIDASNPDVLTILNAAIANRYFDFPAPIGFVKAHQDFRVIAAGNTFGTGADYDYVGRTQLDAATLNRFVFVKVDYDKQIEESLAKGDKDLLGFCRKFRDATAKAGIRTVVSYRNIEYMAQLKDVFKPSELISACLTKGLERGDLLTIQNSMSGFGVYTDGFNELCKEK